MAASANPAFHEDHSAPDVQPLNYISHFHSQPGMQEVNGGNGLVIAEPQEETQQPGMAETAGNPSSVVHMASGINIGVTEHERKIEEQRHQIDEERVRYKCQVDRILAEKADVENQLTGAISQLRIKDEQLRDMDSQLQKKNNELVETLKTRNDKLSEELQSKEREHNNCVKTLENKELKLKEELLNDLKKLLKESLPKEFATKQTEDRLSQLTLRISHLEGELAKGKPANPDENVIELAASKAIFWKNQVLGTGAFGTVYEGQFDGKPCAVKIFNEVAQSLRCYLPTGGISDKAKCSFIEEGECLKQIKHENVVKLYDVRVYPHGDYPVLVMEKMVCTLTCYLSANRQNPCLKEQLSISCNIASALEYLHRNGIIHRDLCSENVLLDRKVPIPIAKVSDFGMSTILKDFNKMSSKLSVRGQRIACYPPEWLDDPNSCDKTIDIFMFGVVMTQIALRIPEIESKKQRCELIGELSESHVLKKFIMHCVKSEQNERPLPKELHTDLKERLHQKSDKN